MNREQRRKFNKKHHTNFTANDFALMEMYAKVRAGDLDVKDLDDLSPEVRQSIHFDNEELVPEGKETKLNAEEILSRPTKGVNEKFLNWIKENQDKVFHVTREQAQNSLVCLKEDVEECKENFAEKSGITHVPWLFDIYSDLLFEKEGKWVPLALFEN